MCEVPNSMSKIDDMPDNEEMSRMIDEERMTEYENCEWRCRCNRKFNTEEAIVDEASNISCPACGEIVMCDEFRIEED